MPGQDPEPLIDRARQAAHECGLDFEIVFQGDPMYVDPTSAFIKELLQVSGCDSARTVCYGTDASAFGELRNLAVYGPGSIDQAHTADEWISLEQLTAGAQNKDAKSELQDCIV